LTGSERIEAFWVDRSRRDRPVRVAVPIRLAPLPCWRPLEREQRNAIVRAMLDSISETARIARLGKPPLGSDAIVARDPFAPVPLERHRPPRAFASDPALIEAYEADRRCFVDAYRMAARAYQGGARNERFPAGAILPSRGFEKLEIEPD
jgi:hypothetical protein